MKTATTLSEHVSYLFKLCAQYAKTDIKKAIEISEIAKQLVDAFSANPSMVKELAMKNTCKN